jgi:glutathione S-transferase
MIQLFTFPEAFGLRNVSPFCLKVEMALSHLGQKFEIVHEHDPRKSPKGKLPYIIDGGRTIADSELILEYLDEKSDGALYGQFAPGEYGRGVALTRLAEDHLYWLVVASRWLDDDWFPNVQSGFFSAFPPLVRNIVGTIARRQVRKTLALQGLGKHNFEEQKGFARRDFKALTDVLEGSDYLVGDRVTVFDFAVASLLAGMIDNKPGTWVSVIAEEYPALRAYTERIQGEVGVYARA